MLATKVSFMSFFFLTANGRVRERKEERERDTHTHTHTEAENSGVRRKENGRSLTQPE
jgi:hypothetical protein